MVQGVLLHLKVAAEYDGIIHVVLVLKMQNVSEGVMEAALRPLGDL